MIEASGVSDPWRIAQIGLADPGFTLEAVIVLVDAAAVLAQARDPLLTDTLERQLMAADLVVLNKTDLADAAQRRQVHAWIEAVAPSTPRFEAVRAELPEALLVAPDPLRARTPPAPQPRGHAAHAGGHHGHHRHDAAFESWSMRSDAVLSASSLRALLSTCHRACCD